MSADDDPGEFALNTRVQIVGLTSRTELNGQTGTVVGRDAKYAERWHVKLDETSTIKSFKYENLWEVQEDEKDDDMEMEEAVVSLTQQMQDTVQELSHLRQEFFAQRSSSEDIKKLVSEGEAVLERLHGAAAQEKDTMDGFDTMKAINEAVEREVKKHMKEMQEKATDSQQPAHEEQFSKLEMDMKLMRAEALRGQKRLVELERFSMRKPGQEADNGSPGAFDNLILQRLEQSEKLAEVKIELLQAKIDDMGESISLVRSKLSEIETEHAPASDHDKEKSQMIDRIRKEVLEQVRVDKSRLDSQDKGGSSLSASATMKLVHDQVEHEMEVRMKDVYDKVEVMTHAITSAVSKLEQQKHSKADKAPVEHSEGTIDALAEMRGQMSEYRADIVELQGAMSVIREQLKQQEDNVMRTTILKCLKRVENLEKATSEFGELRDLEARIKKLFASRCVLVDRSNTGEDVELSTESHTASAEDTIPASFSKSEGNGKLMPNGHPGALAALMEDIVSMRKRVEKLEDEKVENDEGVDRNMRSGGDPSEKMSLVDRMEKIDRSIYMLEARLEDAQITLTPGIPENGNASSSQTPQEVKVLYQRLAGVLEDVSLLQSEVGKCGQRLTAVESRGSVDTTLTAQVQALSEYLIDTGVIESETRFLAVQHRCKHRREIKAARATGWAPNASASEILQEGEVLQTLSTFVTALELVEFRFALGPAAPDKLVQRSSLLAGRGRAEGRLDCATEVAQSQPNIRSLLDLQEARLAAEVAGVNPQKLEEAKELIRTGIATATVSSSHNTENDLSLALELAKDIGGDAYIMDEIKEAMRINRHEAEKVEKVLRKLKVATCWATSKDHDRLREVVLEAEQTKLAGSQELRKAKGLLRSLQFPRYDARGLSFSAFLKNARPKWTDVDVANATAKLEKVGVVSTEGLLELLRKDGEQGLQTLLRDAGLKVFSEDTLKAFSVHV